MRYIKFEYRDQYTNGNWEMQECKMDSLAECVEMYGLNDGSCEYKILENLSEEEYFAKLEKEHQNKHFKNYDVEME